MQEDYKEFTGKNLDEAMAAACDFYGVERGKLEIEIINDAKTGIFGLVGAKKAAVRARRARIEGLGLNIGEEKKSNRPEKPRKGREVAPRQEKAPAAPVAHPLAEEATEQAPEPEADENAEHAEKQEKKNQRRPKNHKDDVRSENTEGGDKGKNSRRQNTGGGKTQEGRKPELKPKSVKAAPRREDEFQPDDSFEPGEKLPEIPLDSMDQDLLSRTVLEAVNLLTRHIAGETEKELEIGSGKVRVRIHSGEDSGLLIGRDGQTLSALQYLVSCMASRTMGASVRVQIDAGDYRERQMEKLGELALELAEKVKENGRPQSTRPLSAFQRRAVHMALQDHPDVQTHSKGEGGLKRVIIVPRKSR